MIFVHRTFISLLKIAGLDELLRSEGHQYTVFVPIDDAFDAMETRVLESLMLDSHKLKAVCNRVAYIIVYMSNAPLFV